MRDAIPRQAGASRPDEQVRDAPPAYYGKYRGTVADNVDPDRTGRLKVLVPALTASATNWALPCTPYGGPKVGLYMMPPVGANVWVEFEGGNPDRPIWTGCFWGEGEAPGQGDPSVKLIQTDGVTLSISDRAGVITLTTAGAVVTVSPETVSVRLDPSNVVITAENISAKAPIVGVVGQVTLGGPVEVEGAVTIAGAQTVTGDVNVLGAQQVEGNLAVAGVIEGVVVPPVGAGH
jgi:phage baseplate assembly protein gpV